MQWQWREQWGKLRLHKTNLNKGSYNETTTTLATIKIKQGTTNNLCILVDTGCT